MAQSYEYQSSGDDTSSTGKVSDASESQMGYTYKYVGDKKTQGEVNKQKLENVSDPEEELLLQPITNASSKSKSEQNVKNPVPLNDSDEESLDSEARPLAEIINTRPAYTTSNSNYSVTHSNSRSNSEKFSSSSSTMHSSQPSLSSGFTPSVFGALVDLQRENAMRNNDSSLPLLTDSSPNHDSARWDEDHNLVCKFEELDHISEVSSHRDEKSETSSEFRRREDEDRSIHKTSVNTDRTEITGSLSPSGDHIAILPSISSNENENEHENLPQGRQKSKGNSIPSTDDDVFLSGARMDQSSSDLLGTGVKSQSRRLTNASGRSNNESLQSSGQMEESVQSLFQGTFETNRQAATKRDEEMGMSYQDLASAVTSVVKNTSPNSSHAISKLDKNQGSCFGIIQNTGDAIALASFIASALIFVTVVVVFEVIMVP